MLVSTGARLGPSGVQSAVRAGLGEIYTPWSKRLEQVVTIRVRVLAAGTRV